MRLQVDPRPDGGIVLHLGSLSMGLPPESAQRLHEEIGRAAMPGQPVRTLTLFGCCEHCEDGDDGRACGIEHRDACMDEECGPGHQVVTATVTGEPALVAGDAEAEAEAREDPRVDAFLKGFAGGLRKGPLLADVVHKADRFEGIHGMGVHFGVDHDSVVVNAVPVLLPEARRMHARLGELIADRERWAAGNGDGETEAPRG